MMGMECTRLVCGFGRCGTSLALQMLAAGGASVAGEWPAFEPPESHFARRTDPRAWGRIAGKAVKLLDPHQSPPPVSGPTRAVWLARNRTQQAASQAKFGHILMGLPSDRRTRKAYERSYARDEPVAFAWLRRWTGAPVRVVRFEDMILRPTAAAAMLCDALGLADLDQAAMAAVVRPRDVACYPGLIEVEMLAEPRRSDGKYLAR